MPVNPDELEELRRRLAAAVAWICPRWLVSRREDIIQNGMVQLLRQEKNREGKRDYSSTYLKRVAHGATVDEIRRLSRRKENPLEESMEGRAETGASGLPAPDVVAHSTEIGAGIRACLLTLIRPRQLAVTLHLQGCTVQETARLLGWTPKRADNMVYRGMADLRRCLARKGLTP